MFLTVNELVGLPGLPGTLPGIRMAMKKRSSGLPDLVRKRQGTKAYEYHLDCLPTETQQAIRSRMYQQVLNSASEENAIRAVVSRQATADRDEIALLRNCPAILERKVSELTDKQKQIADSRATLAMEIERLRDAGMSRTSAVKYIASASRIGSLPRHLQIAAEMANARKGSSRAGVGTRSLQEWLTIFESTKPGVERMAMLAPGHLKAKKPEQITWLPAFLAHWRNRKGPSLREAYRDFQDEWSVIYADQPAMAAACPSYDAVRRAMEKLPRREKARGRVSGSAALAYECFQKRDWSLMPVNGCWIADGKSLEMKVAHPDHGRPFTPELTLIIDGRTRFITGWSLALSESVIAVADAYRYAMRHFGKPLFVYSDNGGGETNKTLDADVTGIFSRLGIEHPTSIPGRPQSRGIIERLNKGVPRRVAMQFDTFSGDSADREHARITSRAIQSAIKAQENGRELTPVQRNALGKLPSWQQLLDAIASEVDAYNNTHEHRELPKRNGRHMTPAAYRRAVLEAEGDDIEYLTDVELREAFMPEMVRTAQRGWLRLFNNDYFSEELIQVDSEEVRVAFDIHDPSSVIVRRMDGTYVCTAIWNGNKRAAIPVSAMDVAVEKRRQRRLNRIEDKRQEIEAEGRSVLPGQRFDDLGSFIPAEFSRITEEEHYFFLETDREEYLKKTGNTR
ncbi:MULTISPECIES: Mu transposase C-terminal domain-containing protein [Enterobacter]|uniref:Mu transposase C-terminal domain-containing protein n=1 Tax=Enterobacter TaxID=547 RepID=UPI0006692149|nr:Mu transposase C-terminal domain-containing protein [Enterobacter asburiae]ELW9468723.1 transposase [Enterobacter asburiae]MDU4085221.1 Mu transposase C-terminal domain-containing protein [Enterobacter asburiae]MDU4296427.1 Mu transposase C-terminal domain-containing protein [Enterobacter asburiae]SAA48233.1 Mu transposase%2C C-terminal [Enterobacter asburiae]